MSTHNDLVAAIIEKFAAIQRLPSIPLDKDALLPIPRTIPLGNGEGLVVSKEIDQLIDKFARRLHAESGMSATSFTASEWGRSVRDAFGPALEEMDIAEPAAASAPTVLARVNATLAEQVKKLGIWEHAFGCALFDTANVAAFDIGQVRFEPRIAWADRMLAAGHVSSTTHHRLTRLWNGAKLRKRKASFDSAREEAILDCLGRALYVCSVNTDGFATGASKDKAMTAAKLAIAAIALLWTRPSTPLESMGLVFDKPARERRTLMFGADGKFSTRSEGSGAFRGMHIAQEVWRKERTEKQQRFEVAAEIIAYFLTPGGAVRRARLMNTLGQALLWFHEACRESTPLMAIVKFAASMDALATGRGPHRICELLEARVGIKGTDRVHVDGLTLKQVVERIYKEGRSRTVHGTNDRLIHDWTEMRALAEFFSRLCLVSCMDWAGKTPALDDPRELAS